MAQLGRRELSRAEGAEASSTLRSSLPSAARQTARQALAELARRRPSLRGGRDLRSLAERDGRGTFRARVARGLVVVKVAPADRADDKLDRVLRDIPPSIAPKLLASGVFGAPASPFHVRVLAHVEGRTLSLTEPLDDDGWGRVASSLVVVHRRPAPRGRELASACDAAPLLGGATAALRSVERQGLLEGIRRRQARSTLNAIRASMKRRAREKSARRVRRLCHGDLRPHNMVDTGRGIRLIDFEYAGAGDPAVDLALMSVRTPLDDDQELRLLDAYLARTDDGGLLARYFNLRPVIGLLSALNGMLEGQDLPRANAELARVAIEQGAA